LTSQSSNNHQPATKDYADRTNNSNANENAKNRGKNKRRDDSTYCGKKNRQITQDPTKELQSANAGEGGGKSGDVGTENGTISQKQAIPVCNVEKKEELGKGLYKQEH